MVQGKINRDRHTDHLAGHHSIWTNQCPLPPSSPYFFTGQMLFLPPIQQRQSTDIAVFVLKRDIELQPTNPLSSRQSDVVYWRGGHVGLVSGRASGQRKFVPLSPKVFFRIRWKNLNGGGPYDPGSPGKRPIT